MEGQGKGRECRWKGKAEGEKGRRRGTGREEEREKNKEKGSRYTPPPDRPHLMRPLVIAMFTIILILMVFMIAGIVTYNFDEYNPID